MSNKARGWKTYTAAAGAMLVGLGLIAKSIATGEFNLTEIIEGATAVIAGLGFLGIGHKFQKMIEAFKES